jgi:starch phosphorylase
MKRINQQSGTAAGHVYGAKVPATRPAADYTARLIPHQEGVAIPLEIANILWQR